MEKISTAVTISESINWIQRKGDLIYWLIYVQKYNEPFDDMLWRDELTRMMGSIK